MGVGDAVLLDTHALVWAASDPARLGSTARVLIENPATTVFVSAASAWEVATKDIDTRTADLARLARAEPAGFETILDAYLTAADTALDDAGRGRFHCWESQCTSTRWPRR